MPFPRPTLTELRRQVATDINASLPGVDALLRYSNLGITGEVLAALASGHYGYLDWIALNSVPFTATGEYLEGWAALRGVTRRPATNAKGAARFPATNGSQVPAGTIVNRIDGVQYVATANAIAADGAVVVPIESVEPGTGGNAAGGAAMMLAAGISGVSVNGTVSTLIGGGADIEEDGDLRSRMLAAYASPPQGGSITDYPAWALTVPGVTRCWIKPSAMGPGTIVLMFMMDTARADAGGFPQGTDGCASYESRDTAATGDQLIVANAIFPKQSVTALVYAVAPKPNNLTLTVRGIASLPAETKTAIADAVQLALRTAAVPGGVTNVSSIESAIASVAGTAGFVLTAIAASAGTVSDGGVGNITSNAGTLPTLAGITFAA
ncbi:baseplate J/gp47 family protein [Sphingomonas sp. Leaf25]|uniref:baseplate J/gp47 family protein n=1 Tax=Sphingomonas sp. Leaf25 TaxID=1735692 RepID=UPI0006F45453|nr:baseplate J/gp47 family protein [Sphingomonas sp. Leaf25]KQN00576.1 hypothetical protein ASE78_05685 [Sphingomonas sp. Leaf25]